jgi:hypothetical protein
MPPDSNKVLPEAGKPYVMATEPQPCDRFVDVSFNIRRRQLTTFADWSGCVDNLRIATTSSSQGDTIMSSRRPVACGRPRPYQCAGSRFGYLS